MSFADSDTGYLLGYTFHEVLGTECAGYGSDHLMAKTTDGGTTWKRVTPPPVSAENGSHTMYFATPMIGIVLGSHPWVTTDGSHSWHRVHLPGTGYDAIAADGQLWVIAPICSHHCDFGVFSSPLDTALRLRRDPRAPQFRGDLPYFVHGAGNEIYIDTDPHLQVGWLWRSADGATWMRFRGPRDDCAIAAWDATGLAAVCNDVLYGVGEESKLTYVSYDAARSWSEVSAPSVFGYIDDLAAGSSTNWVLTDARSALQTTINGGHSWNAVTHFPRIALPNGVGTVQYLAPDTFIAIPAYQPSRHVLVSHDDGRTWSAITFPKWPYR